MEELKADICALHKKNTELREWVKRLKDEQHDMARLQGQGHAKTIAAMRDAFLSSCVKKEEMEDVWANIEKIMTYQKEYAAYMSEQSSIHVSVMTGGHRSTATRVCPVPPSVCKK